MADAISLAVGCDGAIHWAVDPRPGEKRGTSLQLLCDLDDLPTGVRVNGSRELIHSQVIRDLCDGRLCDRRRRIVIALLQKAGVTGLEQLP